MSFGGLGPPMPAWFHHKNWTGMTFVEHATESTTKLQSSHESSEVAHPCGRGPVRGRRSQGRRVGRGRGTRGNDRGNLGEQSRDRPCKLLPMGHMKGGVASAVVSVVPHEYLLKSW